MNIAFQKNTEGSGFGCRWGSISSFVCDEWHNQWKLSIRMVIRATLTPPIDKWHVLPVGCLYSLHSCIGLQDHCYQHVEADW